MIAAYIPSPSEGVWHLGSFPIRGYAVSIIVGIVVAIWMAEWRWRKRGGTPGAMQDLALWCVPFGIVGGRLYHVATDWHLYFGEGKHPIEALYIWKGGLGIWGAVFLGAVGAMIGAYLKGLRLWPVLDAIAPGVLLAQGIGRWGNWWNQELYGKPTTLPWGLKIDPSHYPTGMTFPEGTLFHPTFLYECLWCVAMFFVILWLEKRFTLGYGKVTALYVMLYCVGRGIMESLRIDTIQLENVLGLRWGMWMAIGLFVVAGAYLLWALRNRPGREPSLYRDGHEPAAPLAAAGVREEPVSD